MHSDRAFAAYALTLMAAAASVITASVLAGHATLPSAGVFLEHVALSFGFRTAYKSFDGFEWAISIAEAVGVITENAKNAAVPGGAEVTG